MLIALISDIHGNLEALETVLKDIDKRNITEIYCLGDVVGYGPNPKECLEKIRERNIPTIRGNHEQAVITRNYPTFNKYARIATTWTIGQLDKDDIKFLKTTPSSIVLEQHQIAMAHGAYNNLKVAIKEEDCNGICRSKYLLKGYQFDEAVKWLELYHPEIRITFQGHTHHQQAVRYNIKYYLYNGTKIPPDDIATYHSSINRNPLLTTPFEAKVEHFNNPVNQSFRRFKCIPENYKNPRTEVTVGAVGQPRDKDSRAAYSIYDTETTFVIFKRIPYDIDKTADKIHRINCLPAEYLADRLFIGR